MKRRDFLKTGLLVGGAVACGKNVWGQAIPTAVPGTKNLVVPLRCVTRPPGFHWFGYYDKLQFDPTGRFALAMRTDIDQRTPQPDDMLEIGLIDLDDGDRWTKLGTTTAWSWQQGCMLQWIPGSSEEVIWNDREGDRYISRVMNVKTGRQRTLPKAVYALSPDGKWAVGTEFSRINALRPGYGYVGLPDPYFDVKAPEEIGIYRLDLASGDSTLLASLGRLAKIPHEGQDVSDNFHWFNHLLVNTDGSRITFLHRWRKERTDRQTMARTGWTTRMFTLGADGADPYIISASGFVSHFVWADATHICGCIRPNKELPWRFYLLEDKTGKLTPIGHEKMTRDGHNTFVPGTNNRWILNDEYPDKERYQPLYLYDTREDRRVELGRFFQPREFTGEWRVDLHARMSPDGRRIMFDSTHSGERQMWLIDLPPEMLNG